MTDSQHLGQADNVAARDKPARRRGVSRKRRAIGMVTLITLVGGWGLYAWATDEPRLRAQAEQILGRLTGGRVIVDTATFSLADGLHLMDVSVAVQNDTPTADSSNDPPVIQCGDLQLKIALWNLVRGGPTITEIVATNATVNIVKDEKTGRVNWQQLTPEPRDPRPKSASPLLRLQRARLRVFTRADGQNNLEAEIPIALTATPAHDNANAYEIDWHTRATHRETGRSILDQQQNTFATTQGGLPTVSINAIASAIAVPAQYQRWLNALDLEGSLRPEQIILDGKNRTAIKLALSDARLSIPLDEAEVQARPEDRYLALTNVDGAITYAGSSVAATLEGTLDLPGPNGAPQAGFILELRLDGDPENMEDADDVGFALEVALDRLRLPQRDVGATPAERAFIQRWPKLNRFFDLYDPHGLVDITAAITKRTGRGNAIQLDELTIVARDANASFKNFPYRLTGLTGAVTFTPDGVELRNLAGDHNGGRVTVNGHLTGATRYSGVQLDIRGDNIALDDGLHAALSDRFRYFWDRYNLSGRADMHVKLERPASTPEQGVSRWTPDIRLDFRRGFARYEKFPYPLENITGQVHITRDKVTLTDIRAPHGSGGITLRGEGTHRGPDTGSMELVVTAADLPIDTDLTGAMPIDIRNGLDHLQLGGTLDLTGRIIRERSTPVKLDMQAHMHHARVRPASFPYPLAGVQADLHVTRDTVHIEQFTGWHEGSSVTATGDIERDPEGNRIALSVRADALALTDDLRKALTPNLQNVWDSLSPRGRVKVASEILYDSTCDPPTRAVRTRIEALGNRVRYTMLPIPLEDVRGHIVYVDGETDLTGLTARYAGARFAVDGRIAPDGDATAGTLRVAVTGLPFDETLRQAVPWRLRRTWNVLRPTGTFDMNLETLSFRIPRDGKTAWTYDGAATVHDASFDIGFEAKNVDGTLTGKGRLLGGGESISVDAQLDLDRASIDGRELTRVTGRVRRAADYTVLNIDDLTAQLYGGRCAGRAEVDFGEPDTRYGLSVVVRDIALGDFLNAKRKPDQPPVHASGLVNGNLYLAGTAGHHNSRRGKGEIHATRAQLYKLPFLLSILHVINFTIPDENAFHDAVFKFHIGGERLVFDDLRLRGNAMSMVGQGHAHTPTEALDLTLVVGSPHDLPRVPVLTEFIEGAARELMEVRLTGTIKHPNIVAQPLRGVDAALRTLFSTDRLTNP